jgi:hypothetical protein
MLIVFKNCLFWQQKIALIVGPVYPSSRGSICMIGTLIAFGKFYLFKV